MRKVLLLLCLFSLNFLVAQKFYTMDKKVSTYWAPLADGAVNCYIKLTNQSTNPADTAFVWEYLDKNQPSAWTLGFCALPSCYEVPQTTKGDFIVKINGGAIDFDGTHNFGAFPNYTKGTGSARFLIYRNGQKANADTITFVGTAAGTGINASASGSNFTIGVSPNPVKNELNITLSDANITTASIINLVGKEVMKLNVSDAKTYDVSSLPSGIYFLHITKGENTYNKKFVISR